MDNTSGGIGFFGILGLIFIVLKITGYISWSWWFVLLPIYGPFCIALVIIILVAMFLTAKGK